MATAPAAWSHHDALMPHSRDGMGAGMLLALLAHGALVAALALALRWQLPQPQVPISAELWASVPQKAAPRSAPQTPAAAQAPPPKPAPKPKPVAPPPPQAVQPPEPDAEIALKRREQERRRAAELARERDARDKAAKERAAREKAEAESAAKAQAAKVQAAKEKAVQAKAERERAAAQALAEAERKAREEAAKAKAQAEQLAKQREENIQRMLGQAGSGGGQTQGDAERDAAPSAGYAGRIKARIKPNIVLPAEVAGNPVAEVEVRTAPDGRIVGRRIVKGSGNALWDDTVLRAIDRTAILPRDIDGRIPSTMILVFPRQEV